MQIAIHNRKGSFSDRWIQYCEKNGIPYKLVDAYDSDIIEDTENCTAFMMHHYSDSDFRDALFAKQLLYSLEETGIKVFPNFRTTWHFNDKVAQKYLLEAIKAPSVASYVFYSKREALEWINDANFPKVFKLRGGAGSTNVRLVRTKTQAKRLVKKAFNTGFPQLNSREYFKNQYRKWRKGKGVKELLKGIFRLVIPPSYSKMLSNEKGYVYFQDFIPGNTFDIRVIVIGDKAFALKRQVRKGDFRASGGGNLIYDKDQIDERCVKIGFEVNQKLNAQSVAYDFVFDKYNNPLIIEISYGFALAAYDRCEGYWDREMNWFQGEGFDFCGWMVESVI